MARVLLISVVYPPDRVSTADIVAGLGKGLRDLGHQVSVLSSVPHYNPPADSEDERRHRTGFLRPYRLMNEDGIRVARCFVPQKRGRVLGRAVDFAVFHLTLTMAALRLFRRSEVAIVVSPPLTLAFVAFLLRLVGGTKVIYNAQELWPDVPRDLGVITNPALLALLGAVERAIYRHADAITPIGERFAAVIRERGAPAERVTVIPNFVDAERIEPRPKRNLLSEEWGLADRPVALYAGNIGLTQDFRLVVDAAARLPDVEFLVVGSGAGEPLLQRLLAQQDPPNLHLKPFVPTSRVAELYGLADVVIVPLRAKHDLTTTPSKIFSAMAAGKPVLACAAADTDLADQLARSSAGLTVPSGDVGAFVRALRLLLRDTGETAGWDRDRALAAARQHAPSRVAERYSRLVTSLYPQRDIRLQRNDDGGGGPGRIVRGLDPSTLDCVNCEPAFFEGVKPSRFSCLLLTVKRATASVLTTAAVGLCLERLLHNRIPSHGILIDTTSPAFTRSVKAEIFWGIYESAERRFVTQYVKGARFVIELGSSLGVTSAHIANAMQDGGELICVEPNPELIPTIQRALEPFTRSKNLRVSVLHAAIVADPAQREGDFFIGRTNVESHLQESDGTPSGSVRVEVPCITLSHLIEKVGFPEYVLVSDIEGGEAAFIVSDRSSLRTCSRLVIELHAASVEGRQFTPDQLLSCVTGEGFELIDHKGVVAVLDQPRLPSGRSDCR